MLEGNFERRNNAGPCQPREPTERRGQRASMAARDMSLIDKRCTSALTLPYWDWVKTPNVPPIFQQPPLDALRYTADERRQRNLHLPSTHQVESVLRNPYFVYFGATRCDGTMANGSLEDIHGLVHSWVGPVMKERSTAAYDPIFWFHHANIDRLWAITGDVTRTSDARGRLPVRLSFSGQVAWASAQPTSKEFQATLTVPLSGGIDLPIVYRFSNATPQTTGGAEARLGLTVDVERLIQSAK